MLTTNIYIIIIMMISIHTLHTGIQLIVDIYTINIKSIDTKLHTIIKLLP